jgi:ADP-ribose pyrophosphatase YjhB (NUDIX family)
MDADELPEEALVREVAEETGITVAVSGLQGVAPLAGWSERRGILLLYLAAADGGEPLPADDVSEARWFGREEVPWDELAFESTAEYIRKWQSAI